MRMRYQAKHFASNSILAITFLLPFLLTASMKVAAATPKSALQTQVRQQVEAVLREQGGAEISSQQQALIASRSQRIAETVAVLPMTTVSDDLAQWIDESILALVKRNAATCILDSTQANIFVAGFVTQANARFATLDNAKGDQLLVKKKMLLNADLDYRRDLKSYFIHRLALADVIRLNIGAASLQGYNDDVLSKIILALNLAAPSTHSLTEVPTERDISTEKIESHILTLALIKNLDNQLDEEAIRDSFSFGNLLSLAFNDGDSAHASSLKSFPQAQPSVEKVYNNSVALSKNVTTINLYLFNRMVFESIQVRLNSPRTPSTNNLPVIYLAFANDKASWESLSD